MGFSQKHLSGLRENFACAVYLVSLVDLVCVVVLVYLVSFVQPEKPDKRNKPNKPIKRDRPNEQERGEGLWFGLGRHGFNHLSCQFFRDIF